MIQQGELLAGKYRVQEVLGAGGMGYVVAALHEQLGQRVAVKLLVPALCENEDSVTRFLREARAAVRIHSEHVARVIDVGELTNGAPYMVMEFLSGQDLAEELERPEPLEIAQAIDYLLQASEAVAEAHSIGLIHRDLKPANLFLTHRPDGSPLVKVLDFGISKAINVDDSALEPAPSLTATHSLLGSPSYMSPEQIRRPKQVDHRTDIWSLGSILYELLTREQPFNADSPLALLAAVVSDPLPPVRALRPDVPIELEAVIAKCLEKNPDNRYQNVAELAEALAPFAPRSQPSISRISGIQRATPMRVSSSDKSPSSDRTLQSKFEAISGEAPTEELNNPKVKIAKVALPLTPPEKSTRTDWEASASDAGRSKRRVLVVGAVAVCIAVGVVLWQRRAAEPEVVVPEGSASRSNATALAGPVLAPPAKLEPAKSEAEPAAAPSAAPAAASVAPPAPSLRSAVTPAPSVRRVPSQAPPRAAPLPAAAALTAPPPSAPSPPPKVSDPLDGRR